VIVEFDRLLSWSLDVGSGGGGHGRWKKIRRL